MRNTLADMKKMREEIDTLDAIAKSHYLMIEKLGAILNVQGEYNSISTLTNVIDEQKRLINEMMYFHLQEHKPVVRNNFNPLVSIVMPVYFEVKDDLEKHRQYLKESVSSILGQTYSPVEGIIINDGCGKKETALIEEIIEDADPHIRYFRKENGGPASALNFGIDMMKGEYFAWLSHDDYFYSNHIDVHIDHLRKSPVDEKIITSTQVEFIDEKSNLLHLETVYDSIYGKDYKRSALNKERSYNVYTIGGCSVLIPKTVFQKCGRFDLKLRATLEYDLWRRIEAEYRFSTIPILTHTYRVHPNSEHARIENLSDIVMKEKIKIIDKVPKEDYLEIYGSEVNYLHMLKIIYYTGCSEHKAVINYLNERLRKLGYDQ
ncbi:MAG: glycosyltransferase [Oscillospiraceae bacterium]|jgi:glycosyltransferase involved in cell wall biosynthesis|nr:glycosyltransferase [Oscillospiraceae bacterium]